MKDKSVLLYLALIFLAAFLAMAWQFAHPGFYSKVIQHAVMLPKYSVQFEESFKQGILYPRWMPEDWAGYGSPAFVFYSPLLFFLTALLNLSGIGMVLSVSILKFLCLYAGGVFLYYFLKAGYGNRAALIAAVSYMLLPTRFAEFYFSNTPSGSLALAWMPAVLLFTRKLVEEPFRRANLAGMASAYSLLILTHLATAYIFTPFIIIYGLFGTKGSSLPGKTSRLSVGIAAGIGLSAFFFTSAIFEQGYAQLDYLIHVYDFRSSFLFNPFHPSPSKVEGVAMLHDVMTYSVSVEVALIAAFYVYARRFSGFKPARQTVSLLFCLLAAMFMMTSFSGFLWMYTPGLKSVAFPPRFATVYLLFLSVLLGLLLDQSLKPPLQPFILALIVTAAAAAAITFDAALLFKACGPGISEQDAIKLTPEIGLFPEYLPRGVDQGVLPMLKRDDPLVSSADGFTYRVVRWGYVDRLFTVDSPRGARLRVKTFYFPGWRARVDGKKVPLMAQERTGAILMDVPPGRHEVGLKFTDTPPRTAGKIISLLTLVALALPYGGRRRERSMYFLSDAKESTKESGS